MRSHSSHRSSMHRSSMSSRRHSSLHSSLHRSMNRSHHSSLSSHSMHKRHGISNAHAFAVGKATGVNINGSSMGAHGAALHRMSEMRKSRFNKSSNHSSTFNRGIPHKHRTKDFVNKMKVSRRKVRYTSKKYDYSINEKFGQEYNNAMGEITKYIWIPFAIFGLMFVIFVLVMILFISGTFMRIYSI